MQMEARILRLQELSKNRKASIDEFEAIRHQTLRLEEEKHKVERINQLIQQVPFRYRGKTFNDYKVENEFQTRVKNLAERYVQTFDKRMTEGVPIKFIGKPGTGKTLLSLIMHQELIKAGYSVKYESSLEFINNLLEIKFKSETTFQRHVEVLRNVQFLIIDEVTESINKNGVPSEVEKQLLLNIINSRYQKSFCTLVITNRNSDELTNRLGNPIVGRLSENGITLVFNWNSYRY